MEILEKLDKIPSINSFSGEYRWLSNFWPIIISYDMCIFPSVEHAYQAAKSKDIEVKKQFLYGTPGRAKRLGRKIKVYQDWENDKYHIMFRLVNQKFEDASLRELLVLTKNAYIIEGNNWGDITWGAIWDQDKNIWKGQNWLGKIIMQIRDNINNETRSS